MRHVWRHLRAAWALARSYWSSEERWSARGLLASIVIFNLASVYLDVQLNFANGLLFNSFQEKNEANFYSAFGLIVVLILISLTIAVLNFALNQILQLRWRRWLTSDYLARWLAHRSYYRMKFGSEVDNPDQRVQEDIRLFIGDTLTLGLGLLSSVVSLASFATILWTLSGSATIPIGSMAIVIPGYMFWIALIYCIIGSIIAHLIGRPLIGLTNRQQRFEANFRFGMIRLRETAEGVALYAGETQEHRSLLGDFMTLYGNTKRLILKRSQLVVFSVSFSQFSVFFPYLFQAPRYFSGAIELGVMSRTAGAFGQVNSALSWFIDAYTTFAEWRATIDRLRQFDEELFRIERDPEALKILPETRRTIQLDQVSVALPNGEILMRPSTLEFRPGEATLLTGVSGSGKSTLFRVLAGIWPFARGRLAVPDDASTLFLPQRTYMPIGSLRDALWFPGVPVPDPAGDVEVRAALDQVDLLPLAERLDEIGHWEQILSPGEQQRVAIARALLIKPDWLFLDEATSAMDEDQERRLYALLAGELPGTTVVSIGHRHSLTAYHRRVIRLEGRDGEPRQLVEALVA
jgi:putative ATP-binding cassette transporter